ncbi:MAG: M1 family metallopeptidase [Bacteroidales bacterium]|nr:M1 family metallopeptidase [Bacteroidales bacterium]
MVNTEAHPQHNDILKLILNKPLRSGEKITITTPFRVKFPMGGISRMGHIGQSYQVTQWYPKPAVYDMKGWHPIPYLDQGEFYSEFGSFDVSITIPQNYVVAATGELQTPSEIDWLNQLAERDAKVDSFTSKVTKQESDSTFKTIRYKEKNVHDFAWFADKYFRVLKGNVVLPASGDTVITWAFFPWSKGKLWKKAPEYLHDAVYSYSRWLGDYPYKNCTALEGPLGAGGGMEYPGITIVSSGGSAIGLDQVITHEVGHNWLYGILAFNERDFPYLDEGLNTYYENEVYGA